MNGTTRRKMYLQLCERDGEYCKCCGALANEKQLVVDHRDNNNYNNSIDNLQLLCRTCNYLKNPRGPVDLCVSHTQSTTSLRINRAKEPEFRKYIYSEILQYLPQYKNDLILAGAEYVGVSPVTAKRYVEKMISDSGALEVKAARLRFKEDWADRVSVLESEMIFELNRKIRTEKEEESTPIQ